MSISYKLQVASKLNAFGVPQYYESGDDGLDDIEIFNDVKVVTGLKISERADILLTQASISALPKIKIFIKNSGIYPVIFRNAPSGHRLKIYNGTDLFFSGVAIRSQEQSDGWINVEFESTSAQINNLFINGRAGDVPVFENPIQIFSQLKADGWDSLNTDNLTGFNWYDVTRPKNTVKAGGFITRLLQAQNRVLVTDFDGTVRVQNYEPSTRAIVDIGNDGHLERSVSAIDRFDRMYNAIDYSYVNDSGDTVEAQYLGSRNGALPPESYRLRYGLRVADFNFQHLGQADALSASASLLNDVLYGNLARFKIKAVGKNLRLLDRVRLNMPNWAGGGLSATGIYMVMARTFDLSTNSQDIEVVELTASQLGY